MKNIICVFAVICGVVSTVLAQELRKPIEVISFVVKSTYPVSPIVQVGGDGRFYVWYDYWEAWNSAKDKYDVTATKLEVYEKNNLIKVITIPAEIQSTTSPAISNMPRGPHPDGIYWTPYGGANPYDDKIEFKGLKSIGFLVDSFVFGPFDYTVIRANPVGIDNNGFLYVAAECTKKSAASLDKKYYLRRFKMIYKVSQTGQIKDSFIYAEAKYIQKFGQASRNPWEWSDSGQAFIDAKGNFYCAISPLGEPHKTNSITIRRWRVK